MSKLKAEERQRNKEEGLYFLGEVCEEMLGQPGVYVSISVLVNSPLMEPDGARSVVTFLMSLPFPSVVLVVDSPNRHDIMAIRKQGKRKICPEEARRMALERGNVYVKAISDAINDIGSDKVTVIRWDDIFDENKAKQEEIILEHYNSNASFRQRVDEIAMDFVNERAPNSRFFSQRTSHAAKFILDELPVAVTGISYKNRRYVTEIYASSTLSSARGEARPGAPIFRDLSNDLHRDPMFAELKKKLVDADDGMEAHNGFAVLAIAPRPADNMEEC